MIDLTETFQRVKTASKSLALLSDQQRNDILMAVADAIVDLKERVLAANEKDLAKMDMKNPLYDRLQLTEKRLNDIAADMRNVASLPTPLGHITKAKTLPNGLRLYQDLCALWGHRHDIRGTPQCDLRCLLALLQEW